MLLRWASVFEVGIMMRMPVTIPNAFGRLNWKDELFCPCFA